jgi:putative MATE family efflux protein
MGEALKTTKYRNLTEGHIAGAIWALAAPMLLANGIGTAVSLISMGVVGRLSPSALAATGVSTSILMLLATVFMGIGTASMALVSRAIGAQDQERANHAAAQSMVLTLVLSGILSIFGYIYSADMLRLLGVAGDVVELGTGYLHVFFSGVFFMFALGMAAGALRGAGDVMTPLIISAGVAVLNVALLPVLVFGWFNAPAMGVKGAALANVSAQAAGFTAMIVWLLSGRLRLTLTLHAFKPDLPMMGKLLTIGLPNTVQMSLRSFMVLVLTGIVAPFGTAAVAAFNIGSGLQMLGFMPTFAIAEASATLVGQNLGAKKPHRAEMSALICAAAAVAVMAVASVIMYVFATPLTRVFNGDADVVREGTLFLQVAAAGYVFAGASIVLSRAISGSGDTVPPMLFALFTLWGLQVPLAYWLSKTELLQVTGVWWAGVAASVVLAALSGTYFYSGRWKRVRV